MTGKNKEKTKVAVGLSGSLPSLKLRKGKGGLRVAVGLSGGVDSAVSAHLLKKQGYEVTGVHVVCWDEGPHCKAREDRQDALKVALALDIPFEVLDFQKEYKERVIDRFYADYKKGLTPNPDVWCNSEIKFGMFLEWAISKKYDFIATGHYAKISGQWTVDSEQDEISDQQSVDSRQVRLLVPEDAKKDQTYFLYQLGQEELSRVMFPLQDLLKSEVRKIAKKAKLPVADKKDSQGICFVGDVDIQKFLRRRLKEKPGEVVTLRCQMPDVRCQEGKHRDSCYQKIGVHKGVWFYTIGERGGWEVDKEYQKKFKGEMGVLYVIDKDVENNRLVVGFGAETYRNQFQVRDLKWIVPEIRDQSSEIRVRLRHGGELIKAVVSRQQSVDRILVTLEEPQRGVSPGQAAVFYSVQCSVLSGQEEIECLGGGVIA